MSIQVNITGLAGDDLEFDVALTFNGSPLNLASITSVTAYLKPTAVAPDSQAKTYTTGNGLTVTDPAQGQLTWLIPHGDVPGSNWYRFTVTDAQSHLSTALYGRLTVQDV